MIKLNVPQGQNGEKLSKCVGDMLPNLQQSDLKKMFKKGDIKVNGKRFKKDAAICEGDMLEVYLPPEAHPYPTLEIAFEDNNIIIVNKKPGISVVNDKNDGKPTLEDLLKTYMEEKGEYAPECGCMPHACHRLDHNTGGLTIFAKNNEIYDPLIEAIRQRRIVKFYKTIAVGEMPKEKDELRGFLYKDPRASKVKIVNGNVRGSLPIVTRYSVEKTNGKLSWLNVELVTGRTHQIRAHLASIGNPILGDDKYGSRSANKKYGVRYQALWATKIVFYTGANNVLAYLDKKEVETNNIEFPYIEE